MTDCPLHCGVIAIGSTSWGKTNVLFVSFLVVLTDPSLVLLRFKGLDVEDVTEGEGEGGAGGRFDRGGGGGRFGRESAVRAGRARLGLYG